MCIMRSRIISTVVSLKSVGGSWGWRPRRPLGPILPQKGNRLFLGRFVSPSIGADSSDRLMMTWTMMTNLVVDWRFVVVVDWQFVVVVVVVDWCRLMTYW